MESARADNDSAKYQVLKAREQAVQEGAEGAGGSSGEKLDSC